MFTIGPARAFMREQQWTGGAPRPAVPCNQTRYRVWGLQTVPDCIEDLLGLMRREEDYRCAFHAVRISTSRSGVSAMGGFARSSSVSASE